MATGPTPRTSLGAQEAIHPGGNVCLRHASRDLGRAEIEHLNSVGLVLDIMPLDSVEFDVLSSRALQGSLEVSLNTI
jgi:hypothetical protein